MKIKTFKLWNNYFDYGISNLTYKQFNYAFKYLDFDKLDKDYYIYFENKEVEEWFYRTYINSGLLVKIYKKSPLGYQWLKDNWGKDVFRFPVFYPDKQELKTIVNKVINIKLIRG